MRCTNMRGKKETRTWIPMILPARGQISNADEERMQARTGNVCQ